MKSSGKADAPPSNVLPPPKGGTETGRRLGVLKLLPIPRPEVSEMLLLLPIGAVFERPATGVVNN